MNKILLSLLFVCTVFIYSADSHERYLNDANRLYIQGDYKAAFSEINKYFFLVENESRSEKADNIGEKICYFYIRSLFSSSENVDTTVIEKLLDLNKPLKSTRVIKALELLSYDDSESSKINLNSELDKNIESVDISGSDSNYSSDELLEMLKSSLLDEEKTALQASRVTKLVTALIFLLLIVIGLTLYFIFFAKPGFKFESLPTPETSPTLLGIPRSSYHEFSNLFHSCKAIGREIDEITGRKNNAVNSAELVFKVSTGIGYSERDSLIFFAAALVYDVGFLNLDKKIMRKDSLSSHEFNIIKNHVKYPDNYLDFVPDNYRDIFMDAVTKHHENLDGSGYTEGLIGEDIPYIARVIRVVESYISQISVRDYRKIIDKESAISHLKSEPGKYDLKIVEILDRVI